MRRLVSAFCLLAFWPAALFAETPPSSPRVWRAGVETLAAPYTFGDPSGQPAGFSVELLEKVAAAQGLKVEFVLLDWPTLLEEFKAGRIDIICNIADTAERRSQFDFTTTTMLMRGRMFRREDGPPVASLESLRGLRIAVPPSSRAGEYLQKNDFGLVAVPEPGLVDCVRAVFEKRADVVLATDLVTFKVIRDHGFKGVVASDLEFPDFNYRLHFGVPKNHAALLEALNEGLATLHKDGTYDALYEKWLGELDRRPLRARDLQPYLLPLVVVAVIVLAVLLWQRALLKRVSTQARAIRENEERLRLVFEGSQDGFWDWEVSAGRILRSPRWAGMLGYTLEEIGPARESFLQLLHPDDRKMMADDYQRLLDGKDHFHLEFRMKAKSGEWKWIMDRGKVVARDPRTGAPLRITGTHTDITPRKLAEEQADRLEHKMQETQKLESLGVLAGGIAHDFNNLLTVILGNSTMARLDLNDSPANRERLDAVVSAARRAAELCHQLLAYAGRASYSVERVNLNEIATETARLVETSIGKHAKLEFSLQPNLPLIEGDAAQLRQVVMNLVVNAAEALGSKPGTIQISTEVTALGAGETADLALATSEIGSEMIGLRVSDTGSGMTPEVLARIFDPFFSTKFTGRGLGLAAVLGILRAHRGTVKVQSRPGHGSTFRIYLPALRATKRSSPVSPVGMIAGN